MFRLREGRNARWNGYSRIANNKFAKVLGKGWRGGWKWFHDARGREINSQRNPRRLSPLPRWIFPSLRSRRFARFFREDSHDTLTLCNAANPLAGNRLIYFYCRCPSTMTSPFSRSGPWKKEWLERHDERVECLMGRFTSNVTRATLDCRAFLNIATKSDISTLSRVARTDQLTFLEKESTHVSNWLFAKLWEWQISLLKYFFPTKNRNN